MAEELPIEVSRLIADVLPVSQLGDGEMNVLIDARKVEDLDLVLEVTVHSLPVVGREVVCEPAPSRVRVYLLL